MEIYMYCPIKIFNGKICYVNAISEQVYST